MKPRVHALTAVVFLGYTAASGAQSVCASQSMRCQIAAAARPGSSCYCNTPYGPIPGVIVATANPSRQPQRPPAFCCTPAGKLGPYANPGIPAGGSCSGTTPHGVVYGQACY